MRKWVVGGIGVLGVLLSFSVAQASWPGEIVPEPAKEIEKELRGYRNLNIAVDILKTKNFSELSQITERILDLFSHYDVIDKETLLTATNAYLVALENIKNSGGLGFGAMLEEQRTGLEMEAKFEPSKQKLLELFSVSLMMSYVKEEEVFYSADLLERMVASGELSIETQRTFLNITLQVHAVAKKSISRFLVNNIFKPLLSRNEILRWEFREKLGGVDLVELSEVQEKPSQDNKESPNVVRIIRVRKGSAAKPVDMDLVESREGEVRESKKAEESQEERPAAVRRLERPHVR